jgi:aryl-alcohol dehydrogenase
VTVRARAAVVREASGPFEFFDVELEAPRADEVLVRIVACGICHTDVAVRNQDVLLPLPMVLGHEGSGVVEAVGAGVRHVRPGDHVVLSGDACGDCRPCQHGLPSYCAEFVERNLTGWRIDGSSPMQVQGVGLRGRFVGQSSFASHTVVSARSAIPIPRDLPLELMGPLGCGLTTGVGTVMNSLRPPPGSTLVVFGVGTVGLAAVMGARLCGVARVIAVDTRDARLAMALELGATHAVRAGADAVEQIRGLTGGGADFAVECSGAPVAVRQAVDCLGRPGMAAQVGATPAGTEVALDMDHMGFGRGLKGVVMGDAAPRTFVPYLAELFRAGRLPFDRFVRFYPFADIEQAIHDSAVTGEVIKPILRIG